MDRQQPPLSDLSGLSSDEVLKKMTRSGFFTDKEIEGIPDALKDELDDSPYWD